MTTINRPLPHDPRRVARARKNFQEALERFGSGMDGILLQGWDVSKFEQCLAFMRQLKESVDRSEDQR